MQQYITISIFTIDNNGVMQIGNSPTFGNARNPAPKKLAYLTQRVLGIIYSSVFLPLDATTEIYFAQQTQTLHINNRNSNQ